MQKIISSTVEAFASGCMIFMVTLCASYWANGEAAFNQIQTRFDFIVLGIFIVALIAGGLGQIIYHWNIKYNVQLFIHYGATISTIMVVSIWLEIVHMSYINLFVYFASSSAIFFLIWFVYFVKLKREANVINAAILHAKKEQN